MYRLAYGIVWGVVVVAMGYFLKAGYEARQKPEPTPVLEARCPPPEYNPKTQRDRTWADLYAACRLSDAWLDSDEEGNPICLKGDFVKSIWWRPTHYP